MFDWSQRERRALEVRRPDGVRLDLHSLVYFDFVFHENARKFGERLGDITEKGGWVLGRSSAEKIRQWCQSIDEAPHGSSILNACSLRHDSEWIASSQVMLAHLLPSVVGILIIVRPSEKLKADLETLLGTPGSSPVEIKRFNFRRGVTSAAHHLPSQIRRQDFVNILSRPLSEVERTMARDLHTELASSGNLPAFEFYTLAGNVPRWSPAMEHIDLGKLPGTKEFWPSVGIDNWYYYSNEWAVAAPVPSPVHNERTLYRWLLIPGRLARESGEQQKELESAEFDLVWSGVEAGLWGSLRVFLELLRIEASTFSKKLSEQIDRQVGLWHLPGLPGALLRLLGIVNQYLFIEKRLGPEIQSGTEPLEQSPLFTVERRRYSARESGRLIDDMRAATRRLAVEVSDQVTFAKSMHAEFLNLAMLRSNRRTQRLVIVLSVVTAFLAFLQVAGVFKLDLSDVVAAVKRLLP